MEPEAYEDILDNEARVSEGLEESDQNPNCEQTKDPTQGPRTKDPTQGPRTKDPTQVTICR